MRYFYIALSFLTIIPIHLDDIEDVDFAKSVKYFTIVGTLVGLLCAAIGYVSLLLFDPFSTSIIVVASMSLISGALHTDGLADTFDGFLSSRSLKRKLDIMHDSRIGTMGVLAILFVMLLKISLLFSISSSPSYMLAVVFLMPLAGRVSQILSMSLLPYAREDGLGLLFWDSSQSRFRLALILFLIISILVCIIVGVSVFKALFLTFWLILITGIFSNWCYKAIEGGTGDTLGAITEIIELVTVAYFAI